MAVRFAFLEAPMQESNAVMQVPIFWPRMIGIAMLYVIPPVSESACRMPTEAEEL